MATGACGINCDVCRLQVLGFCSTCGPGTGREAREKAAIQTKILGAPCPILACAVEHRIDYCLRDCEKFPCDLFRTGPYPLSEGFLRMQERRWHDANQPRTPSGELVVVPENYWEDLRKRDVRRVCAQAMAKDHASTGFLLPFLKEYLLVDLDRRCLCRQGKGRWEKLENPLLELLCLVYLLNAGPEMLQKKMVGPQELKCGHFFRGPHELQVKPLLARFGHNRDAFSDAAAALGGEPLELADASYAFLAFPKIPLYYLLWEGDEEFHPRLSILFDRSIECHLAADAIWGLSNLVSGFLIKGMFGT